MTELTVLQAVRFKGRTSLEGLAATLGDDVADVAETVGQLTRTGLLVDGTSLRISPGGRARLGELLAAERRGVDRTALAAVYREFHTPNREFKQLATDWQLRNGRPNIHDDAEYDAAVVARLERLHQRVMPIIAAAAAQLPRLGHYSAKLRAALDRVKAGDIVWLSRPIIDSYHTVWFELHEELILAAGRTRESEAETADAQ
ncbi:MarR family transcriptional regulator [Mycobacterium sp.]|uniref:MarR family transcriptional regulator n=1 Tax=Mycobacterium sp. TaxID=1785 RepID=UPI0031D6573F